MLLRTTTRISHCKSVVEYDDSIVPTRVKASFLRQPDKFVMIPAHAKRRRPVVEERIARLAEYAESFPYNRMELRDRRVGVITSSVAYQYAREVMPEASFLKLGMGYPLPARMIREFASEVERLLVVEELDPFLEEMVKSMGLQVEGKRYFPPVGEFSLEQVEAGFQKAGLLPLPLGEGRGEGCTDTGVRLAAGYEPRCVESCPKKALSLSPQSAVVGRSRKKAAEQLLKES